MVGVRMAGHQESSWRNKIGPEAARCVSTSGSYPHLPQISESHLCSPPQRNTSFWQDRASTTNNNNPRISITWRLDFSDREYE